MRTMIITMMKIINKQSKDFEVSLSPLLLLSSNCTRKVFPIEKTGWRNLEARYQEVVVVSKKGILLFVQWGFWKADYLIIQYFNLVCVVRNFGGLNIIFLKHMNFSQYELYFFPFPVMTTHQLVTSLLQKTTLKTMDLWLHKLSIYMWSLLDKDDDRPVMKQLVAEEEYTSFLWSCWSCVGLAIFILWFLSVRPCY